MVPERAHRRLRAAAAVGQVRHGRRRCDADQPGAHPVQHLDGDQRRRAVRHGGQQPADREHRAGRDQQDAAADLLRQVPGGPGYRNHDALRHHDEDRQPLRGIVRPLGGEALAQQRQHGGVAEVEQPDGQDHHQEALVAQQGAGAAALLALLAPLPPGHARVVDHVARVEHQRDQHPRRHQAEHGDRRRRRRRRRQRPRSAPPPRRCRNGSPPG